MKVRRFTPEGMTVFTSSLKDLKAGEPVEISSLVVAPAVTEIVVPEVNIDPNATFCSRLDCAKYLHQIMGEIPGAERDAGLWCWMSALYFDQICPPGASGGRNVGDLARYVPDRSFRRFYRHLLLGPFLVVKAHRKAPEAAIAVLAGPLHKPGDLAEQLTSRMEILTNAAIMGAASQLYYDSAEGGLKRGAGGKGAGSPRRLADLVNQLDLTVDMYALDADRLIDMLPREFNRFKG